MITASRRGLFRGIFGRTGFELRHETANDVLMRVGRSLDPQILTDELWTAYVAMRRGLRFATQSLEASGSGALHLADAGDPSIRSIVSALPIVVVRDLVFLLRIETILRSTVAEQPEGRELLLSRIRAEIHGYLAPNPDEEPSDRDVVDSVVQCLTQAAGFDGPAGSS